MTEATEIFIGLGGGERQALNLKRANRHGLIAGATGTGKTVTLQGLAEGFSRAGVPVFVSDVKSDLSGLAMAGSPTGKMHEIFKARAAEVGDTDWAYAECPVQFWDLFGEQGHPIRTTISEMGPLLLARLMGLNEVQEGVLNIAFHVADKDGLLLLDLDDLQAMLSDCADRADELSTTYGNDNFHAIAANQRSFGMTTLWHDFTVAFNRHSLSGVAEFDQQCGDCDGLVQPTRLAVERDSVHGT